MSIYKSLFGEILSELNFVVIVGEKTGLKDVSLLGFIGTVLFLPFIVRFCIIRQPLRESEREESRLFLYANSWDVAQTRSLSRLKSYSRVCLWTNGSSPWGEFSLFLHIIPKYATCEKNAQDKLLLYSWHFLRCNDGMYVIISKLFQGLFSWIAALSWF